MKEGVRAKQGKRLPVVFSLDEVQSIFQHTSGTVGLALKLIYGSDLRISECCRLRIKDIDFDQHLVVVRSGKGDKDRTTLLPSSLVPPLRSQIARVIQLHDNDLAEGYGRVWIPDALLRKYPSAATDKAWQYMFPSQNRSIDPQSKVIRRYHVSSSAIQRG